MQGVYSEIASKKLTSPQVFPIVANPNLYQILPCTNSSN